MIVISIAPLGRNLPNSPSSWPPCSSYALLHASYSYVHNGTVHTTVPDPMPRNTEPRNARPYASKHPTQYQTQCLEILTISRNARPNASKHPAQYQTQCLAILSSLRHARPNASKHPSERNIKILCIRNKLILFTQLHHHHHMWLFVTSS